MARTSAADRSFLAPSEFSENGLISKAFACCGVRGKRAGIPS
jgi:hypothetical protein